MKVRRKRVSVTVRINISWRVRLWLLLEVGLVFSVRVRVWIRLKVEVRYG